MDKVQNLQERRVLQNRCSVVGRELTRLLGEYADVLRDCPTVDMQLRKAGSRAHEYENGTFIVLVVGPVKSGKSTLVNLIANAYVSPTHFLECTVRPSIISQRREGEDCRITVYTTEDSRQRARAIDSVIDSIRGIENGEWLRDVVKSEFELTPENIKDKVELGLQESLSAETLVTSITTPGGRLMKQDVFIIDMPGFDGEYANIDDPVYDTIAQRADLIVFVQSSNSAISKVSGQFLKKLHENNKDVPVSLIHNVFDSAHWRDDAERRQTVEEQKQFALGEIRRLGFKIDAEQCFSINLGKVEDSRNAKYADDADLRSEAQAFDDIENYLHDRVISNRDVMRLSVCLGRTQQQLQKLTATISEELGKNAALLQQYNEAAQAFEALRNEPLMSGTDMVPQVNPNVPRTVVEGECQSRISQIQPRLHRSDSEARTVVTDFVRATERLLAAQFPEILHIAQTESEMYLQCRQRLSEIDHATLQCGMPSNPIVPERITLQQPNDINLMDGLDLTMIVPHKLLIPGVRWMGHSSEDLVSYLNAAKNRLVGTNNSDSERGYIETTALPQILQRISEDNKRVRDQYRTICDDYLQSNRQRVLSAIIPDLDAFNRQTAALEKLRNDINNINF
ncbi:MAG: dynamin family protein [Prevotella sp.]|nr:dynamin family protein [Prevotella sp.]